MQVKISYTSDISDVPKEVAGILQRLVEDSEQLSKMVNESQLSLKENELSVSKIQILAVKEKLQKMFGRLTDCQSILDGYEKALNPQLQELKNEAQNR